MTTPNPFDDTERVLDRIADKFDDRYDGAVDRETIEHEVRDAYTELAAEAKVDTLLPALTEHEVGERLADQVGRPAPLVEDVPEDVPPPGLRAGTGGPEPDRTGLGRPVV